MSFQSVLHGHTCTDCNGLVTCCAKVCPIRATRHEATFKCGCKERKAAAAAAPAIPQLTFEVVPS